MIEYLRLSVMLRFSVYILISLRNMFCALGVVEQDLTKSLPHTLFSSGFLSFIDQWEK